MRICPCCKQIKSLDEYGIDRNRKNGKNCYCKICVIDKSRIQYRTAPKRIYNSESAKKRRAKRTLEQKQNDAVNKRNSMLRLRYGLSIEQYENIFKKQAGKCGICERHQSEFKTSLAVDHNHITGEIRRLLCPICNRTLGFLKVDETKRFVQNLTQYVEGL